MYYFWHLGVNNFLPRFPFSRQQMMMEVGTLGRETAMGEVMGVMMVLMMMTTLVILMKGMVEMRAVSLGGGNFSKRFTPEIMVVTTITKLLYITNSS